MHYCIKYLQQQLGNTSKVLPAPRQGEVHLHPPARGHQAQREPRHQGHGPDNVQQICGHDRQIQNIFRRNFNQFAPKMSENGEIVSFDKIRFMTAYKIFKCFEDKYCPNVKYPLHKIKIGVI